MARTLGGNLDAGRGRCLHDALEALSHSLAAGTLAHLLVGLDGRRLELRDRVASLDLDVAITARIRPLERRPARLVALAQLGHVLLAQLLHAVAVTLLARVALGQLLAFGEEHVGFAHGTRRLLAHRLSVARAP